MREEKTGGKREEGKRRQQRHRSQTSGSQPVNWELLGVSSDPFTVVTLDYWKTQICSLISVATAKLQL